MQPIPKLHKIKFALPGRADKSTFEARIKGINKKGITIAYWDFNPETGGGHLSVYSHEGTSTFLKYLEQMLGAKLQEMDSCNN